MSSRVYALGDDGRWHIVRNAYAGCVDTACGSLKMRCSRFQARDEVQPRQEVGDTFYPLCSGCWMERAKQNGAGV